MLGSESLSILPIQIICTKMQSVELMRDTWLCMQAFLVSPDAGYVTGETLVVAGGMPSKL